MVADRLKIGIIGAGAMGTLFGYHFAQTCDVTILDNNAAVLDAIERSGLRVNDQPPRAVAIARKPSVLYASSVLFLFVKAVDTLRALRPFAGQLNPATPVVSLQNGVGNEDAIKTALGGAVPVVLGITTESSISLDPGHVRSSETGTTIFGSGGAAPETSRRIADLLVESGLRAAVAYDIRGHLWGKLAANAAINAISALLDCPAGFVASDAQASRLARAIAQEAASVASAMQVKLPFTDPWTYITEIIAVGADAKSSMAFDLAMRHPTEIDHINGAVVAAGRRLNIPTAYNESMVRLIKAREHLLGIV